MDFKNKSFGFTLIELLIVTGIIILLSGIGLASYHNFSENQMVTKALEEVKSKTRAAASSAVNNEKDCNVCGGSDNDCKTKDGDLLLKGWYVDFAEKKIYGQCEDETFGDNDFTDMDNFTISTTPSTSKILFKTLGQGTDITGQGVAVTISFNEDSSKQESFFIDKSGSILPENPY